MVIGDLHFIGIRSAPLEAYSPLVINADTVLSLPVPVQCFESVCGRDGQKGQGGGSVDHFQFSLGNFLNVMRELSGKLIIENPLRLLAFECPDHDYMITLFVSIVNR
jgi:hypothetical protein